MSILLPRFRAHQEAVTVLDGRREKQARRADWNGNAGEGQHADNIRLRGIPCIARGVAGVSSGTDPYAEYARREGRAA